MHVYEVEDGEALVEHLKSQNIDCEIIGTLPSDHDIDVWVDKDTIPDLDDDIGDPASNLGIILGAKKVIKTDMDSLFYLSRIFGHVDVFFEKPSEPSAKCMICGDEIDVEPGMKWEDMSFIRRLFHMHVWGRKDRYTWKCRKCGKEESVDADNFYP